MDRRDDTPSESSTYDCLCVEDLGMIAEKCLQIDGSEHFFDSIRALEGHIPDVSGEFHVNREDFIFAGHDVKFRSELQFWDRSVIPYIICPAVRKRITKLKLITISFGDSDTDGLIFVRDDAGNPQSLAVIFDAKSPEEETATTAKSTEIEDIRLNVAQGLLNTHVLRAEAKDIMTTERVYLVIVRVEKVLILQFGVSAPSAEGRRFLTGEVRARLFDLAKDNGKKFDQLSWIMSTLIREVTPGERKRRHFLNVLNLAIPEKEEERKEEERKEEEVEKMEEAATECPSKKRKRSNGCNEHTGEFDAINPPPAKKEKREDGTGSDKFEPEPQQSRMRK